MPHFFARYVYIDGRIHKYRTRGSLVVLIALIVTLRYQRWIASAMAAALLVALYLLMNTAEYIAFRIRCKRAEKESNSKKCFSSDIQSLLKQEGFNSKHLYSFLNYGERGVSLGCLDEDISPVPGSFPVLMRSYKDVRNYMKEYNQYGRICTISEKQVLRFMVIRRLDGLAFFCKDHVELIKITIEYKQPDAEPDLHFSD